MTLNHYPRHIGDFAAATQGLTLMERGAYDALLDQYYVHERPLPLDMKEICRMAVATSTHERRAVGYVLGRFFTKDADGFHNKRADLEISAYREKAAKASASAASRWSERNAETLRTDSEGNAKAMRTHNGGSTDALRGDIRTQCDGNANQNQNQNQEVQRQRQTARPRSRATPLPENFAISDRVRNWAEGKNLGDLGIYLETFVGRHRANGKLYVDWEQTFMNAIREDWYELRGAANRTSGGGRVSSSPLL